MVVWKREVDDTALLRFQTAFEKEHGDHKPLPAFLKQPKVLTNKQLTLKWRLPPSRKRQRRLHRSEEEKNKEDFFPIYGFTKGTCQSDLLFIHRWPVLTLIDVDNKIAVIEPSATASHDRKTITSALNRAVSRMEKKYHNKVSFIETDQGGEFGPETEEMLQQEYHAGFKKVQANTGQKTRMGVVERFHRTFRNQLQKWADQYQLDTFDDGVPVRWRTMIPVFEYFYNNEWKHRSIGTAPMELKEGGERFRVDHKLDKTARLESYWDKNIKEHQDNNELAQHFDLKNKINNPLGKERGRGSHLHEVHPSPWGKSYLDPEDPVMHHMPYNLAWYDRDEWED